MTAQLRPRPFLISKIAELLTPDERSGRVRAASLAGVHLSVFQKACEDRDLTVGAIISLIVNAGKISGNHELDSVVNELASYFVPPRRKLIFWELVEEYERQLGHSQIFLDALQNGGRLKPAVVTENCGNCEGPVEYIKICPACARSRT